MKHFTKCYLGALLLLSAVVVAQSATETERTAKIKHGGVVQPTLYDSVQDAVDAAKILSEGCYASKACNTQVGVIPSTITVNTSAPKASSSKVSSSKASSTSSTAPVATLLTPIAITSSTYQRSNTPDLAIDGVDFTRWESVWQSDPQWLRLDLGASYALGNLTLDWEDSNADSYTVEGSTNATTWVTLVTFTGGSFGNRIDSLDLQGAYRYLKLTFTKRPVESQWGYSIYELRVMSAGPKTSSSAASSVTSSAAASSASRVPLAFKGTDKLDLCQPTQRADNTTLPLSEVSHYTAVLQAPGVAGVSVRIEKKTTPCFSVALPFDVYPGDAVRLFTFDTAGLMSSPSDDAAAGGVQ